MTHETLTADAEVILLCCSQLAIPRKPSQTTGAPYSAREWTELARKIHALSQRPGALLSGNTADFQRTLGLSDAEALRLTSLLSRGGQLAIELDTLAQQGIWVMTRADTDYPVRLKASLGGVAPPVLFGAGSKLALERGFLAVVGSRDVDEPGSKFALSVGVKAAQEGVTIVSGMSRGVDYNCTFGCLDAGGSALGVLADGLEKSLRIRKHREAIAEDRLTFVTAVHPRAGFSVGNAMARNKYIYCLAHFGLVVASSLEKGGTRAGAIEALKSRWVPVFVRSGDDIPPGNRFLLDQGALPFEESWLEQEIPLSHWLKDVAADWAPPAAPASKIKSKRSRATTPVQLALDGMSHSS